MTAFDHRAEAEALLDACDALRDNLAADIPWAEIQAAATLAQVHATLAPGRPVAVDTGWRDLLAAARTLLQHVKYQRVEEQPWTALVRDEDIEMLARCVQEATEAGR